MSDPPHLADTGFAPAGLRSERGLARLAAIGGSPQRTAAAFSFGVFLSFSPFFGLQIAIGLGVALLLRLSRAAVLIGLCANLPWIMIPWYAATTAAAAAVLGVPLATDFGRRIAVVFELPAYRAAFWERAAELVGPFFWSFVIGSTAGAVLLGVVTYAVTVRLLRTSRV